MVECKAIKVLIVDDHEMVRKGLDMLLTDTQDVEVVGAVNSGKDAYEMCCQDNFDIDVILMDIAMPNMDGIEATRIIKKKYPQIQIIALTSSNNERNLQHMLKAGVIGYHTKDISGDKLIEAIRKAHNGKSTLSPPVAQTLIQSTVRPPTLGHDLTQREREVLKAMATGLNNKSIAHQLDISTSTIKNHVSNILGKLRAKSRTHAVALAIENDILSENY